MTQRKYSPLHNKWHRRVEGQIKDAIYQHPEWFNIKDNRHQKVILNSIAKRIVGEIVADFQLATLSAGGGCSIATAEAREGGGFHCPPKEVAWAALRNLLCRIWKPVKKDTTT